jgi:hypothetical protein
MSQFEVQIEWVYWVAFVGNSCVHKTVDYLFAHFNHFKSCALCVDVKWDFVFMFMPRIYY